MVVAVGLCSAEVISAQPRLRQRVWPPHAMSRITLGVALALWLTGVSAAGADVYALVIGVNECPQFQLPDGTRPKPLRGAEADADGIAQMLVEQYRWPAEHVQILKGKTATRTAVAAAFTEMTKRMRPDDTFVFHFSGHGTQIPDRQPFDEPDGLDEALCPADATATGDNLMIDDDLGLWLEKLACRRVTVILDCCHSGTGIKDLNDDVAARFLPMPLAAAKPRSGKETKSPWRDLKGGAKSLDRQVTAFYACQAEQQAYERRLPEMKAPARVGQFSHYLLEGLRDKKADADHDGVITGGEAIEYARHRLDETFNRARRRPTERQDPALEAGTADSPLFGGQ
jgi:uncharacterized caspase-like protein